MGYRSAYVLCDLEEEEDLKIRVRWCELVIRNNTLKYADHISRFLKCQGKQKYNKPLYEAMAKGSKDFQSLAVALFEETRGNLHPHVQAYIKESLKDL